ncbi:hypothetical protein DY000_02044276 [Brassica cretica]|uniref:Uncharacterized protein n=1 Tax=Brassica cretica TaxID=69181 RepID=A0ABQ7EYD0_BRACR|nr:hypothetical protein DY000_02044276 [Brassica cretica]
MVERRSPLVLSSTRATLRSVLNSLQPVASIRDGIRLPAGILRWQRDGVNDSDSKFDSLHWLDSRLKRLSINAGSLVVINNIDIGIQRIAQVVVLDPPPKTTTLDDDSLVLDSLHTMLVFPTYDLMMTQHPSRGNEVLEKYFVAKFDEGESAVGGSKIGLELEPVSEAPGYASHLRVKSDKGLIDSALHKYFGTDRQMSRGDVFRVYIDWNCGSSICIPCRCSGRLSRWNLLMRDFFESITPKLLLYLEERKVPMPLQGDAVNVLASVLSPPLCPSALSSKLRVAVLLHGLPVSGIVALSNLANVFVFIITGIHQRYFCSAISLGSQDGSQGDRVGVASEIASVIRELTEPVSNGEYSSMEEESNDNSSVDEVGKFRGHQVLLIASAESTEGLSPTIRRCFSHEIRMGSLNDEQRSEMLSQSLQGVSQLLNVCEYNALKLTKRKVLNTDSDDSVLEDDPDSVVVEYVDFIKAMDQLSPSLSISELKKYEDQFEGRSS